MDSTQILEEYAAASTLFLNSIKVEAEEELILPDTVQSETASLEANTSEHYQIQLQFQCMSCNLKFYEKFGLDMHICSPPPSTQATAIDTNVSNNEESDFTKNLVEVKNEVECKNEVFLEEYNTDSAMPAEERTINSYELVNQDLSTCCLCNINFLNAQDLQAHLTQNQCQGTTSTSNVMDSDEVGVATTSFGVKLEPIEYKISHISSVTPDQLLPANANNLNVCRQITFDRSIKKFQCYICGANCRSSHTLNTHLSLHKRNKTYKCGKCRGVFTTETSFQKHVCCQSEKVVEIYNCSACNEKFTSKYKMFKHKLETIHGLIQPYSCHICDAGFPSKRIFENHLTKTHRQKVKPYKCSSCSQAFTTQKTYEKHLITHIKMGETYKYECDTCHEKFSVKTMLYEHKDRTKHGSRLKCDLCKGLFVFPNKRSLEDHLKAAHATKLYQCKICNDVFTCDDNYQEHLSEHTDTG